MSTRRPLNLLFLWTDEQRPDTIGAYGNPHIATPHLDRLAAQSVLFEQAYCTIPVCTPSRGSVLTGVYPHTHGATHNNIPLPEHIPTIAELLRPHGYYCGYAGKWHLGNELRAQRGFDWWSSMEDGYIKDHQRDGFSTYHQWLVRQGYQPPDSAPDGSKVFKRSTAARLPEEAGKPAFLAHEAGRFLDEHIQQRPGTPFALYVNFLEPHMPFFGPWDQRYAPELVDLPPTWYAEPDPGMPLRYRVRRQHYMEHNEHVGTNDEAGWRALKARYWGLASLVDKYVGRILEHLRALSLAEHTIIVYSTDHGDMMGEHRLLAKGVQYEGAVRVPLIIHVPGQPPRRLATPTSQIDLLPTLLELLGVDRPAHLQGQSLVERLLKGDRTPDHAEVVIEWSGARGGVLADGHRFNTGPLEQRAVAAQQRTIRRGRWKLTVDEAGQHELYDLAHDPLERHNLLYAGRLQQAPGAAEAVEGLWERLRAWQRRTADPLVLPTPAAWDGATS
jgi:arylsulfatase